MAHVTIAASETTFEMFFRHVRDNFRLVRDGKVDLGTYVLGYEIDLRLKNGTIDLRPDNTVEISQLDLDFVVFKVSFGLDIPQQCIGGQCVVWVPVKGCLKRLPKACIFADDPDVEVELDLAPFNRTEVSFIGSLRTTYHVNQDRPVQMDAVDASSQGLANQWQVYIDTESVDVDLVDVPDILGDLMDQAVDKAFDDALGLMPGWAKSLLKSFIAPLSGWMRDMLDVPDNVDEWLTDKLDNSFGLGDLVTQALVDHFAREFPINVVEDPYPMWKSVQGLNPVFVPIRDLTVRNTDDEMIAEAFIG